jgi:hypothetical protein
MRGRPHTRTAWAPKTYHLVCVDRITPASAERTSPIGGGVDTAEEVGQSCVVGEVFAALLVARPVGSDCLRPLPELVAE